MIKEKLRQDLKLLIKQHDWLHYSMKECNQIGLKEDYTIDEFGKFETLCSRYSRGIDFLIRKIFRTIDEYEFENQGTLIDTVNHAHKRGLFEDIETFRFMKDIRNTIVHEYIELELAQIFAEVLQYAQELIRIMKTTEAYIAARIDDN